MDENTIVTYRAIKHGLAADAARRSAGPGGLESRPRAELDWQTSVQFQQALRTIASADRGDGVMSAPCDQVASLLQSELAERADRQKSREKLAPGGFEAKFDTHDLLGWVGSIFSWIKKLVPHDWILPSPTRVTIPDNARIGLLADWGTGLYGAPVCAKSMANDAKGFDVLIHLGDVYYSGTEREIEKRFLPHWPFVARHAHLALNSNHEMYSGGYGYFDALLPALAEKSTALRQNSSCFALENSNFVIVGLDTGYVDHHLSEAQLAWLGKVTANLKGRKVIFLSHHQPYSLLDKQGPSLVESLRGMLQSNQIFAWYWGHEHRLVIYEAHSKWGLYGRCIGHGGMPYFRDELPGVPTRTPKLFRLDGRNVSGIDVPHGHVLDGPNRYVEGHENEYGPNGYSILELDGSELRESHRLPDGTPVHEQTLR